MLHKEEGKEDDDDAPLLCGQIIDIVELRDITKEERGECGLPIRIGKDVDGTTRYALIRKIIIKDGVKHPKLNAVEFIAVGKDINEAIITNQMTYIDLELVKSNAYLFHQNDIKEGLYNPAGVGNAYLVRRLKQNPDSKNYTQLEEYKPFPNKKCYSRRQWDARVAINEQGRVVFSRKGRIKSRTEHLHFPGMNVEIYDDINNTAQLGYPDEYIEFAPKKFKRYKRVMRGTCPMN